MTFPTQLRSEIGRLFDGYELSPFLKIGIALAFFHDLWYLHCSRDLLKNIRNDIAIFSGDTFNMLWLIQSGADALFTAKFVITSTISYSVQRMSLTELPILDSRSGNKTFSSFILEIQLTYLLKRSHFSLSSYTILTSV